MSNILQNMDINSGGAGFFSRETETGSQAVRDSGSMERRIQTEKNRCESSGEKRFSVVYREVARENECARKSAGRMEKNIRETDPKKEQINDKDTSYKTDAGYEQVCNFEDQQEVSVAESDQSTIDEIEATLREISSFGVNTKGCENEQAWMMIRDVLAAVSETFNLDIIGKIEDLELGVSAEEVVGQFTEILFALKSIVNLLVDAAEKGVTLDVQGVSIEPQEAITIEKSLRTEIFRLELALKMIGIGGEVSNGVSEKQDIPTYSGIPQAVDPSTMSVSSAQISQIIGSLIDNSEENIQSVIEKMVRLSAASDGKSTDTKTAVPGVQTVSTENQQRPGELGSFETQVLRKILGIDSPSQESEKSQNASSGNSGTYSENGSTISNVNAQMQNVGKSLQNMLDLSEQNTDAGTAAGGKVSVSAFEADAAPKLQFASFRSIEESVMQQMIERVNSVIRSGNGIHEIRIHLRPESLGEVHLRIQMDGDTVMAKINVESHQVKQIVESNLQSLRNALAEQNLQAGSLDVSVNRGSGQEADKAWQGRGGVHGGTDSGDTAGNAALDDTVRITLGEETGRRYGANSIEYYA